MSEISEQVRTYWDLDAATYDQSPGHSPRTALELAVWSAALRRLLPPPPARVLDVGAGTGFLAMLLARQGYRVSALDLSPGMLEASKSRRSPPMQPSRRSTVLTPWWSGTCCGPCPTPRPHWQLGAALPLAAGCSYWRACGENQRGFLGNCGERAMRLSGALGAITPTTTPSTTRLSEPSSRSAGERLPSAWCRWWSPLHGARPGSRGCATWSGPRVAPYPRLSGLWAWPPASP
jgi:hypothetical protein